MWASTGHHNIVRGSQSMNELNFKHVGAKAAMGHSPVVFNLKLRASTV